MDTSTQHEIPRPRGGRRSVTLGIDASQDRLSDLEQVTADLAEGDLGAVLAGIASRARDAAGAEGCLVVVGGADGAPVTGAAGLAVDRVDELVQALVNGTELGDRTVTVPVVADDRLHGHLAVLGVGGTGATPSEDVSTVELLELLAGYASHAAMAAQIADTWGARGCDEHRLGALLTMSQDLASAVGATEVAEIITTALREVVGCRGSSVMLWDPTHGVLLPLAATGHDRAQHERLLASRLRADQTPELSGLLTKREPALFRATTASPELAGLLAGVGAETVVVMPLLAGDTLMGIATASWGPCVSERHDGGEAFARISGIAHQAATALHKARLLETVDHQAHHDALTGLPNRAHLVRRLDEALRGATESQITALLFCDLDRFKQVNDRLGHAAGDELLRQAAVRLRGQLRPDDVVARISSDEFAILLVSEVEDEAQAVAVAHRLVEALDEPFRIDGRELRITSSIGVALHTGPDGRGERLLGSADAAMYEAKRRGRDQVAVAGEVDAAHVVPSLEAELSRAVDSGQLRLFFQPVVSLSPTGSQVVVGAEALLRWAHPRLGLLAPGAFLPLAEEAGLVTDLDLWALGAACQALAGWPNGEDLPLRVAVNLASSTLVDPRLLPSVRSELKRHGLGPERLHLEVVESRSLADLPGVIESLVELRQMGVRISLDDFGTGFSTLSWLQALPVDQIKIDRSFIMTLPGNGAPLALVRGVLALARELGIEVIAEGVEEPEQLALLRAAGCEMVQGYLLGRPGPILDPGQLGARAREILRAGDAVIAQRLGALRG